MVNECLGGIKSHMNDAEFMQSSLMMIGTILWAMKSKSGELFTLSKKINTVAEEAFGKHMNNAKVKQAVAWLQSLSVRGSRSLVIH